MKNYLIAAAIALAAVGVWQRDAIRESWETRGMSDEEKAEWELKDEGVLNEDDEFEVDDEFDDDLNGLDDELDREEASGSDDLDDLEASD